MYDFAARRRPRLITSLLTATALAAVPTATAATAQAASTAATAVPQRIVMTFESRNGTDLPTRVLAAGPISGRGTETQTETPTDSGETVVAVLYLPGGTVTLDFDETFQLVPDYSTCTARGAGTGTWTINAGTGRYHGVRGSGTFADSVFLIGATSRDGQCLGPAAPPLLSVASLVAGSTGPGTTTSSASTPW